MAKFNMNPLTNPMPTQDPQVRNGNFNEVALGYTPEMAMDEAKRCIGCKNRPCVAACPVNSVVVSNAMMTNTLFMMILISLVMWLQIYVIIKVNAFFCCYLTNKESCTGFVFIRNSTMPFLPLAMSPYF